LERYTAIHLVGGKVKRVEFGLGQVVPASDVALGPRTREPGRCVDKLLFPRPGEDRLEVFASLVGRPTWVIALIGDGFGMHIPRAYIYFAIAFSLAVETLNIVAKSRRQRK
jgi:hypothetical protein